MTTTIKHIKPASLPARQTPACGPPTDSHGDRRSALAEGTSRMICSISAAMVGVCLTGVGLLRVVISMTRSNTLADDLLSIDAIFFLTATLAAYFALRIGGEKRPHRLESLADLSFILAMVLLTLACFFITYAVTP